MGIGFLKIEATTGEGALPVTGASVIIRDDRSTILYNLATNESGVTDTIELEAPDIAHSLNPDDPGPFYAVYTVEVSHPGYDTVIVNGTQVFDTETTILPVEMFSSASHRSTGNDTQEYTIPGNYLHSPDDRAQEGGAGIAPRVLRDVVIPDYITVHLGSPNASATNVRVSFRDYIKNVASHEIYPTWPNAALEANIYAQISFALNRIYTEWYPSRGYNFNITNSTAYARIWLNLKAANKKLWRPFLSHIFPYL